MTTAPRPAPVAWTTLATGDRPARSDAPISVRRVIIQIAAAALAVLVVVGLLGLVTVRRIAEQEAVNDAANLTDLLARTVVQPALDNTLADGDPVARQRIDAVVRSRVLGPEFVRVKIWSPDGTIVYSDEPRLIGRQFEIKDDERAVLADPATVADVSDLNAPENEFERGRGKLLQVYRPVWTPDGQPLLFETYARYDTVTQRIGDLWRGFGGIVVSSLLLFLVLQLPLLWALFDRLRRAHDQREVLLRHALDASEEERRRIAADLHDGVVQELVAASLLVAAAGEQEAAATVRGAVGGLRTLLVDLYPPNLHSAGLAAALADLGGGLRGPLITVEADQAVADALDLPAQRLVYRVAREGVRNALRHARATALTLSLTREGGLAVLEVADDGVGIDPGAARAAAEGGHLGLRLLADLARGHGATLKLATAPGAGTRWRLEVPL